MSLVVVSKSSKFFGQFIRNSFVGPNLSMWVWIAATHHGAAIFENLHGTDVGLASEIGVFLRPGVDHVSQVLDTHARQSEVVARRETNHPAPARFAASQQ